MTILHLIHKALYWLPLAVIALVLKAFQALLGWLFIAPFVKADGNLPPFLSKWFEPDDTPIIGDTNFRTREMAGVTSYYRLAEAWGRRNPAYGWDSKVCGIPADIKIIKSIGKQVDWGYDENEQAVYTTGVQLILAEKGYWNLRLAFVIPFTTRGCLCSFGWNLSGGVVNSKTRNLKIDIAMKTTGKNRT